MRTRPFAVACCLLVAAAPVAAEMGFYGWGPRLGVGDDPDQVVIGLHQDFGELVDNLRFQPSLDVGFGDDHTVVSAVLPVHYRFPGPSDVTPYLGGGLLLGWIEHDPPGRRGGDSEFEIAPVLAGGIEWRVRDSGDALLEIQLPGGEFHDAKVLVGWIFRAR